jgi:hypothetical protein
MASIVSAGTTSATALNMSADTTGILQLASNNGTVGLTMDTSQNVGIGTASPTGKLNVVTNNTHNGGATFDSTGTTQVWLRDTDATTNTRNWGFQVSGGDFNILRANDDRTTGFVTPVSFAQAPANSLIINSSGNVGIGTSSPAVRLDVTKSTGSGYVAYLTSSVNVSGSDNVLFIGGYDENSGSNLLNIQTNVITPNGSSYRQRFLVRGDGNVGIGTSSPAALFSVVGGTIGNSAKKAAFYCGGDEGSISAARNEAIRIGRSDIEGNYYSSIWSAGGSSTDEALHWLRYYITNGNGVSQTLACTMFGNGNVAVAGALSKGSGSFRIDHPLPSMTDTHELVHSFIEGPQADLIYRGKVNLVDGVATVDIDAASSMTEGTFVALCRDVQCFTTNESDWTAVRGSVTGNLLKIEAEDSASTASISWMVIGERHDKHMMDTDWTDINGKVIVEPLKTDFAPKTVDITTESQGVE